MVEDFTPRGPRVSFDTIAEMSNNKNWKDYFSRVSHYTTLRFAPKSVSFGDVVAVEGIGPSSRSPNECNPSQAFVTWSGDPDSNRDFYSPKVGCYPLNIIP